MPPSPVVITLRGWNEKQATRRAARRSAASRPPMQDLAAEGAGGVLDHGRPWRSRDRHDRGEIAGHAHLVHADDARVSRVIASAIGAGSML